MNRLSAEADVGKSSNDSSSVPSPKCRRRVGRVTARFAEVMVIASLWPDGAEGGRPVYEYRERVFCKDAISPERSPSERRYCRGNLTLA